MDRERKIQPSALDGALLLCGIVGLLIYYLPGPNPMPGPEAMFLERLRYALRADPLTVKLAIGFFAVAIVHMIAGKTLARWVYGD